MLAKAMNRSMPKLFLRFSLAAAAIAILPVLVKGWACSSDSDCDYPGCNDQSSCSVNKCWGSYCDSDCSFGWRYTYTSTWFDSSLCRDPSKCEVGTYSANGHSHPSRCFDCDPGSYSATSGASTCSACDAGKSSSVTSSSACLDCDPGSFAEASASSTCSSCSPGFFSNVSGVTACSACDAGKSSSVNASSACLDCDPGSFAAASGASTCSECRPGTFSNQTGATDSTTCQLCPTGTYSSVNGAIASSTCVACPTWSSLLCPYEGMAAPDYAAATCAIIFPPLFGLCVICYIAMYFHERHQREVAKRVAPDELRFSQSVPLLKFGEPMSPVLPSPSNWYPAPEYSISSGKLPDGIKLDSVTGVISGTPTLRNLEGHQSSSDHLAFQVAVRAKNIEGECITTLTIRIESPLAAPTGMSCPANLTRSMSNLVVGVPLTPWRPALESPGYPYPTFRLSSPQHNTVSSQSSILPKGLVFDGKTGTISGTPSVATTRFDFTVTASNSSGHCSVTSVLAVHNNQPPSHLSFPLFETASKNGTTSMLFLVGDDMTIDPGSGYHAGLPSAEISIKPSLPGGLSLDAASGKIYGIPKVSAKSTEYIITARNLAGSCDCRMSFEVQEHVPPTLLIYSPEQLIDGGPLHTIYVRDQKLSIAEPVTNGTHLTFKITPDLPSGVYLDENTGAISGKPGEICGRTEYTITASNKKGKKHVKIIFSISEMYDLTHGDEWSADQVTLFLEHDMVKYMKENYESDFHVNERQLFLGMLGEDLLELRDGDISKKVRLGKLKVKGLQDRLKDVFKETEKRKAGLVLTRDEREKLWKKAGASRAELAQSSSTDQFSKFDDWFYLKTGRPAEAADGIKFLMCVDSGEANTAFFVSMGKGVEGTKEEVERLEAGAYGTAEEVAEVKALLHYILYEGTSEKKYKNGIRDKGRPFGTKLEYFVNHDNAKKARLSEAEVVALRFYTTLAYIFMNIPLRDEKRRIDGNPCPLPVTTAFAEEGIKKLRKLNAPDKSMTQESPSNSKSMQGKRTLYRGMRAMKAADDFLELGGTELAFMSTTTSLEIAVQYSLSGNSLLFKILAKDFMVIGADVQWLSAFPEEAEVLYPPLTYLGTTGRTEKIVVKRGADELCFTVVEVEPTMG